MVIIIMGHSAVFTSIKTRVETMYFVEFPDLTGDQRYYVGNSDLKKVSMAESKLVELLSR